MPQQKRKLNESSGGSKTKNQCKKCQTNKSSKSDLYLVLCNSVRVPPHTSGFRKIIENNDSQEIKVAYDMFLTDYFEKYLLHTSISKFRDVVNSYPCEWIRLRHISIIFEKIAKYMDSNNKRNTKRYINTLNCLVERIKINLRNPRYHIPSDFLEVIKNSDLISICDTIKNKNDFVQMLDSIFSKFSKNEVFITLNSKGTIIPDRSFDCHEKMFRVLVKHGFNPNNLRYLNFNDSLEKHGLLSAFMNCYQYNIQVSHKWIEYGMIYKLGEFDNLSVANSIEKMFRQRKLSCLKNLVIDCVFQNNLYTEKLAPLLYQYKGLDKIAEDYKNNFIKSKTNSYATEFDNEVLQNLRNGVSFSQTYIPGQGWVTDN